MVLLDKVVELGVMNDHAGGFLEDEVDKVFGLSEVEEEGVVGDAGAVQCQTSKGDLGQTREGGVGVG